MSHIFITHTPSERDYARKLGEYLVSKGINVWVNDQTDESQERLALSNKAIEEAAAVIIIMSRSSQTSALVLRDLSTADHHKKLLLPVLFSGEKWGLFYSTPVEDVRQGQMPGDEFIERLLKLTPQEADAKNLTPNSTTAPVAEDDNPAFTSINRPAAFRQLTDALRAALDAPAKPKDEEKKDADK